MRLRVGQMIALGLVLGLGGCGDDDSFGPTAENVAGAYSALVFTLDVGVGPINELVLGAEVAVTLAPDGTTQGRLFLPGGGANGGDLDVDLTGTWALNRGAITFDLTADTFLRGVRFAADRDRLTGEATAGHQLIHLTLSRNGAPPLPDVSTR